MRQTMAISGLSQLAKPSHDASRLFGSFVALDSARKLQSCFNVATTNFSKLELATFGAKQTKHETWQWMFGDTSPYAQYLAQFIPHRYVALAEWIRLNEATCDNIGT
jgi:hypothetical protein